MDTDESGLSTPPPATVSLGEAFRYWLKLGFISFGGPAGQIAIMHQDLVERKRWISEKRFLHALNYCMDLPGPEAQQLATYIGWLMHRTWGGVIAGGFFVFPSLFILIGLSWVYMAFGSAPAVPAVLFGITPAGRGFRERLSRLRTASAVSLPAQPLYESSFATPAAGAARARLRLPRCLWSRRGAGRLSAVARSGAGPRPASPIAPRLAVFRG